MKRKLSIALLFALFMGHAFAEGDVYLCTGENGIKEYKNTGITKGCKKVDLPGLTMIPAPARHSAQTASARASSSPSDFPKVDSTTQKARDSDRRQILLDELKTEQQKLDSIQKEYNNGQPERRGDERNYAKYQERTASLKEDLDRTQKNIEALQRELDNLK
jgi:hypothetical protein